MAQTRVIGILSLGEMGMAVAQVLGEGGARVVTCVEGRSAATQLRAREAGIECAPSLDALVRQVDLILSVVPPLTAEPLAQQVAAAIAATRTRPRAGPELRGDLEASASPSPAGAARTRAGPELRGDPEASASPSPAGAARPVYCDANAIGPVTARHIAATIEQAGATFVDGAIIGGAGGWARKTTLYLSGGQAQSAGQHLDPLRFRVIGPEAGQASGFKVLYAGLTKGLAALGIELLAGARELDLLDLLLETYREGHGNIVRSWEQSLPGLPPRASRRAEEMGELAETLESLGLDAAMARAAQATLAAVADRFRGQGAPRNADLEAMVNWLSGA